MRFLNTKNVMAFMLIGQDALNAKLLAALVAKGLYGLHIGNMSITELLDDALLVHEWLVRVQVQKTCRFHFVVILV